MRQAELTRHVRAALKAAADMKLPVTGYRVTFHNGTPCVEVTTAVESASAGSGKAGGVNVEELQARIRSRHAAGS